MSSVKKCDYKQSSLFLYLYEVTKRIKVILLNSVIDISGNIQWINCTYKQCSLILDPYSLMTVLIYILIYALKGIAILNDTLPTIMTVISLFIIINVQALVLSIIESQPVLETSISSFIILLYFTLILIVILYFLYVIQYG